MCICAALPSLRFGSYAVAKPYLGRSRCPLVVPNIPVRERSVKLAFLPPKNRSVWCPQLPTLRAVIATTESTEAYGIPTYSDEHVVLYILRMSSSSLAPLALGAGQSRVFMTRGDDGSFIAKVHNEEFGAILVPVYYCSEHVWARLERIGDEKNLRKAVC